MKRFLDYLKPYFSSMIVGFMIKFFGTIMDLLLPWILAYSIDEIVPKQNVNLILFWGLIMILCSFIAVVTNITANRMASRVARDTTKKIRHDLFEKISYLSNRQIDNLTISSLETRLTTDTYNVQQFVGMMQRLGIRSPILLVGGIIVTLLLDPFLSLVLIAIIPCIGFVVYLVSKKGIPLYNNLQISIDNLVGKIREDIAGIRVIKALSKISYEKEQFEVINNKVVKNEKKVSTVMATTNPMMNLFLNLGLTIVIIVGAYRVNLGLSQTGKIIAFLTYFTVILNAMLSITRMFVIYSKAITSLKRIFNVLDEPTDLRLQPKNYEDNKKHILWKDVTFSYNKNKNNLENISFSLEKGQTLGIIGSTGSGKSTVIKLLLRLYDADKGIIRINGHNIQSIPFEKLHSMFGTVLQHDFLFAGSISENISFGRNLTKDDVKKAASLAQANEFIEDFDDTYDHMIAAKGSNLSGGQKQRVLLSRALAKDPEILILDDSSSALDYKTDAKLRKSILDNLEDTTKIIVAQRISSIMHADYILVIENGSITGYGNHDDLIKNCDTYKEINKIQMGGLNVG